jgi:hypothetical protein
MSTNGDSRQAIIDAASTYLDALVSHDASKIALADNAWRTEEGRNSGIGAADIRTRTESVQMKLITDVRDIRWFVDGENAIAFYLLDASGATTHIVERFRVIDGLIHEIEAILMQDDPLLAKNVIMEIRAGTGGLEAGLFAGELFRMYSRWTERRGFQVELMDVQPGDTAGISKATILIKGENAYGYAKAERGVHRLVRISPFDSNKRRHTSFCAVDVVAEITEDVDVTIGEDDIRTDVYRSSGKGGQGVNTTDSAVRLTHIPTGIVVV